MNQNNEIDISKIIIALKEKKNNIIYMTFLGFFLSIIYVFMATPYYQSYISINPIGDNINSSRSVGGLQSLASEYGVNLNVGDFINERPSFYIPDIVNSRILKKAVINHKWKTLNEDSIDLINYWKINDSTKFSLGKILQSITGNSSSPDLNLKYIIDSIK